MNTSGLSSHTPLVGVNKWTWLDILHLTDAFDVVLGVQCSYPTLPLCGTLIVISVV